MDEPSREIADLRLDIETLRVVIDVTSNGVTAPDALLRACANALYERHARIARLEVTRAGRARSLNAWRGGAGGAQIPLVADCSRTREQARR